MNVLKKFGLIVASLFIVSINTVAQSIDICEKATSSALVKKDPIEFIHNYLLKPSASNPAVAKHNAPEAPLSKKIAKAAKAKSIIENKKIGKEPVNNLIQPIAAGSKKVISSTEVYSEAEFNALHQKNTEKKIKQSPVAVVSSEGADLTSSRLVTKILQPKKEETNIGTSMLEWVKDKYSTMIEVLPNQISNVMLYRFIDEWYGVKYRMGGTSKKGVDCSAFVQTLYKYVFGMDLLRTAFMQFNSSAKIIKNPAELKEGDLVFFKVNSSRISHVGVYLRNNFFVHSASSKGVSIAKLTSVYWSKYFAGGGRIME